MFVNMLKPYISHSDNETSSSSSLVIPVASVSSDVSLSEYSPEMDGLNQGSISLSIPRLPDSETLLTLPSKLVHL